MALPPAQQLVPQVAVPEVLLLEVLQLLLPPQEVVVPQLVLLAAIAALDPPLQADQAWAAVALLLHSAVLAAVAALMQVQMRTKT